MGIVQAEFLGNFWGQKIVSGEMIATEAQRRPIQTLRLCDSVAKLSIEGVGS
jgi:hypothetical protein